MSHISRPSESCTEYVKHTHQEAPHNVTASITHRLIFLKVPSTRCVPKIHHLRPLSKWEEEIHEEINQYVIRDSDGGG